MIIDKLIIHNVRNISEAEFTPEANINVIIGDNGSGKTSVLEAVHLLGFGRSFRTNKTSTLIKKTKQDLTVLVTAGKDEQHHKFGIRKGIDGSSVIRIDGETIRKQSELSSFFPIVNCSPNSVQLLEDGPAIRRRFIDWLVFHVEHESVADLYREYDRALDQRNKSLKLKDQKLAEAWQPKLIELNNLISTKRSQIIEKLVVECKTAFKILGQTQLLSDIDNELSIEYKRGWRQGDDIETVLTESLSSDLRRGTTQHGVHRDDIHICYADSLAKMIFSRGEQKILVICLLIAAQKIIEANTHKTCIWLIDDLVAELDQATLSKLLNFLQENQRQIFITCIEKDLNVIDAILSKSYTVFHVEHGKQ